MSAPRGRGALVGGATERRFPGAGGRRAERSRQRGIRASVTTGGEDVDEPMMVMVIVIFFTTYQLGAGRAVGRAGAGSQPANDPGGRRDTAWGRRRPSARRRRAWPGVACRGAAVHGR